VILIRDTIATALMTTHRVAAEILEELYKVGVQVGSMKDDVDSRMKAKDDAGTPSGFSEFMMRVFILGAGQPTQSLVRTT
jgi:hypothetical protein